MTFSDSFPRTLDRSILPPVLGMIRTAARGAVARAYPILENRGIVCTPLKMCTCATDRKGVGLVRQLADRALWQC